MFITDFNKVDKACTIKTQSVQSVIGVTMADCFTRQVTFIFVILQDNYLDSTTKGLSYLWTQDTVGISCNPLSHLSHYIIRVSLSIYTYPVFIYKAQDSKHKLHCEY